MELIAIVSMLILLFVNFIFAILLICEKYQKICDKKDWYIESLEDEIEMLEDYIERNEEKWKD